MVEVNGTKTEIVKVNISNHELEQAILKNITPKEITQLAFSSWLKSKGLDTDSKLKLNSKGDYFFEEYFDNGSHYSGYYKNYKAYQEGDIKIWKNFQELMNTFK